MRDPGRGLEDPIRFNAALSDFQQARAKASLEQISARLLGKSPDLLSFQDVTSRLQILGHGPTRRETIDVDAIVGSVGRYNDFSRTFLPRRDSDAQRWARLKAAGETINLPPIDVYQIGDVYFVSDGNHRVSIARRQGREHIDAIVTTLSSRVPLTPDDDPDTLIVKSELAEFLVRTRLDVLRPGSDVRLSVAGQVAHLENLIEAYRYLLEEREGHAIDNDEAVTRWHDEAYLPFVEAIREQGVLRYFPGRTETDLYIWIATHQAELRNELGWAVRPETAAANLLQTKTSRRTPRRYLARAIDRLKRLLSRQRPSMLPANSWSQQHISARYSGQLFADLLLLYNAPGDDAQALAQALQIVACEGGRLLGLHIVPDDGRLPSRASDDAWVTPFFESCNRAGVQGHVARDAGAWLDAVLRRAPFVDALVFSAPLLLADGHLRQLLQRSPRPMLLVPGQSRPIRRLLLYFDGGDTAREALFAAAYMAEEWGVDLAVQLAVEDDEQRRDVRTYVELHELQATFLGAGEDVSGLPELARRHDCDLILMGAPQRDLRHESHPAVLSQLLRDCDRPLFVCT